MSENKTAKTPTDGGKSTEAATVKDSLTVQTERKWQGMTDEEIYEYADKYLYQHGSNYGIKAFGKAIEAKLKEKNKW